jgi:hypothetical protein
MKHSHKILRINYSIFLDFNNNILRNYFFDSEYGNGLSFPGEYKMDEKYFYVEHHTKLDNKRMYSPEEFKEFLERLLR